MIIGTFFFKFTTKYSTDAVKSETFLQISICFS